MNIIHDWGMLIVIIFGSFLGMLGFFAFCSIIVTKIGREGLIGKTIIICFSLLNFLYNLTLGSLLCLEFPHRLGEPATERMKRYKKIYSDESSGIRRWRWNIAQKVCWWLNKFDPGHC